MRLFSTLLGSKSLNQARPSNFFLALKDLKDGLTSIYIWPMLGWLEVRQRYRRSTLGPFWLTISTGAMIGGMGPLYGKLFGLDITTYFPYLAISWIVWALMASMINDLCFTFISAEGFIKELRLPLTVHVLRTVWKNLLVFAHNVVIIALVLIAFPPTFDLTLLLALLAMLFIAINAVWLGMVLGLLCARFRDIPNLIGSLVQVTFFLTPVMWKAEMLGRHIWFAQVNPMFHFLEIVRAPLMGRSVPTLSWLVVLGITLAGYVLALTMFARFRARIAYWV